MIASIRYTAPAPATAVLIVMADGQEWRTDAAAPADTGLRARMRDWLASGSPEPYAPPAPLMPTITRRQMLLALAAAGLITGAEALAAATTGAVPASIDAVFAGLPDADALAARITWATMSIAERAHPLIAALIAASLATAEQVDALFVGAVDL